MFAYTAGMSLIMLLALFGLALAMWNRKVSLAMLAAGAVMILGSLWLQFMRASTAMSHFMVMAVDPSEAKALKGWATLPDLAFDLPLYIGMVLAVAGAVMGIAHAARRKRS